MPTGRNEAVTLMSSKSRSKLLAWVLGGMLGCAGLLEGYNTWQSPWTSRQSQINALRAESQQQTKLLCRRDEQSRSLRRWAKMTLPFDAAKAAAVYYPYLTRLTEHCGFTQVALAPTAGDRDEIEIGGLRLTVTAEATVESWNHFFQILRTTPALQDVLRWDLQSGEDGKVRGSVVLEAVRYDGAIDAENAFTLPEQAVAATAFGERNWFGDRELFVAAEGTPTASMTAETTIAEPRAAAFTLIGIYGDAKNVEAWLYDAASQARVVLQRDGSFEVGNQRGSVVAVDTDGVTLTLNGRKQRLRLGDRLQ